jgi:hypothetical protein
MEHAVVVNDDDVVTGRVHIELDGVHPRVERGEKSRKRVFGVFIAEATVCDGFGYERWLSHGFEWRKP